MATLLQPVSLSSSNIGPMSFRGFARNVDGRLSEQWCTFRGLQTDSALSELPILWSQILNVAMVSESSYTSE